MDKPILFFDNEHNNWQKTKTTGEIEKDMALHEEQVSFIPVNNTTPNNLVSSTIPNNNNAINQAYLDYFLERGNSYANFINTNPDKNKQYLDKPYVNNGITIEQIVELNEWLTNHSGMERSALFFDWDRTITCVEGMVTTGLPENIESGTVTYDDLLVFLMGGEDRLQMIKDMFQNIMEHNIKFFILTFNLYASNKNRITRDIYIELLKMLIGLPNVDSLLYSAPDYGYKKANSACYTMENEIITNILPECERILAERREISDSTSTYKARKAGPRTVIKPSSFKKGGKRSKKRKTKKRKTRKLKTRKFKKY